jgi:hypothetical protein
LSGLRIAKPATSQQSVVKKSFSATTPTLCGDQNTDGALNSFQKKLTIEKAQRRASRLGGSPDLNGLPQLCKKEQLTRLRVASRREAR